MAISNYERIRKALELFNKGIFPFVEREMVKAHGETWVEIVQNSQTNYKSVKSINYKQNINWDTQAIINVIWDNWNNIFSKTLGQYERSLIADLKAVRNKWAHQESLTTDDAYRALDTIERLLKAISAKAEASEIEKEKQDVLRIKFNEKQNQVVKQVVYNPTEGRPPEGLKPWREIIIPHDDVIKGEYQRAEFAADLAQVFRGEGSDEYKDPYQFFNRTYFTQGLSDLLLCALRRLNCDKKGEPVIELHTNFGGGKTHSMLALYHMFSGKDFRNIAGIEEILSKAKDLKIKEVKRAVLVGTALSPAQTETKPDGTVIHTLWGELAWQLLGKEGYQLIADSDRSGTSPGSKLLIDIFKKATPCIILIDEWVAYIRQLSDNTKVTLPAGTFDSNMTFAQALTEAAKATDGVLVVASIPASDIETGGQAGKEACDRLQNIFSRLEFAWKPATPSESFEIVRRRLFKNITDSKLHTQKDAVCKAFMNYYQNYSGDFPSTCK